MNSYIAFKGDPLPSYISLAGEPNRVFGEEGTVRNRTLACWLVIAAIAGFGVALQGCGGSPSSPTLTLEDLVGEFDIFLTDNHIDGVGEVHVFITGFSTELEGGTQVDFHKQLGDVELLSLRDKTIQVIDAEVPAGTYLHVSFSIDAAQSYLVEQGVNKPLSIPEENVRVDGPFVVNPGALTSVTLDFDAELSLTKNADGSWSMNPVVVVTAVTS